MATTKSKSPVNREAWLFNCAEIIIPRIKELAGHKTPDFRISCGWPSKRGLSQKKRVIGECWGAMVSTDGKSELFISPLLHDPMDVAGTVAHELLHAAVGVEHGHKKPFSQAARKIGLAGKPTATVPGEAFKAFMDPMLAKLGPYPHAAMKPASDKRLVQATRLLKVQCKTCGYVIRVTQKWLGFGGAPICPVDNVIMEVMS